MFLCAFPLKGWLPCLHIGGVPFAAVAANRIVLPNALRFRTAPLFQIVRRAAPRPFCPESHITMMHRVVVNVVDRGKEMPFRAHESFHRPVKNLPPAGAFLAIPGMTGSPVKSSEFAQDLEDVWGFNQCVIVVRQDRPCKSARGVLMQHVEECGTKPVHPLWRVSDVVGMLIAGSGDEEMQVTLVRAMRW